MRSWHHAWGKEQADAARRSVRACTVRSAGERKHTWLEEFGGKEWWAREAICILRALRLFGWKNPDLLGWIPINKYNVRGCRIDRREWRWGRTDLEGSAWCQNADVIGGRENAQCRWNSTVGCIECRFSSKQFVARRWNGWKIGSGMLRSRECRCRMVQAGGEIFKIEHKVVRNERLRCSHSVCRIDDSLKQQDDFGVRECRCST